MQRIYLRLVAYAKQILIAKVSGMSKVCDDAVHPRRVEPKISDGIRCILDRGKPGTVVMW